MKSKKVLLEVIFIIALSIALGLGTNFSLVRKFLKGEFRQSFLSSRKYPGITFIALAEAEELFSKGEVIFIDSRSREKYVQGHVLGALNIAFEETGEGLSLAEIGLLPEKTLVVYCDGGACQASLGLAKWLHESGFKNIKVYSGGWAEWEQAGLPRASGK